MAPAIFAPSWSRLGSSQKDMEARVRERTQQSPHEARHADVREVEKIMYKRHHDYWSYPIFAFWYVAVSLLLRRMCADLPNALDRQHGTLRALSPLDAS